MFASPWIAAMTALFAWWFSTGAILWLVRRADNQGTHGHFWAVMVGLPFLGAGIYMLAESLPATSVGGIYAGFFAALLIWGWIELAFLTGIITGPAPRDCPPGVEGVERFLRAWGTVAYHEMLLTVSLILIGYASWGAGNMFGFWTFAVLYFARISAKLNLFFGVPQDQRRVPAKPALAPAEPFPPGPDQRGVSPVDHGADLRGRLLAGTHLFGRHAVRSRRLRASGVSDRPRPSRALADDPAAA